MLHDLCVQAYIMSKQAKAVEAQLQDQAPPDAGSPSPSPRPNGSPDPNDPFNVDTLRITPTVWVGKTPRKVEKRNANFTMVPNDWLDRLVGTSGHTLQIAIRLMYQDWDKGGKPFALANGMLKYDGLDRFAKWRALSELERRGLIAIKRRKKRSPIITVFPTEKLSV
jgi:hypothetical protein